MLQGHVEGCKCFGRPAGACQPVGAVSDDVGVAGMDLERVVEMHPSEIELAPMQCDISHANMTCGVMVVQC
jgi:hypothetical protein